MQARETHLKRLSLHEKAEEQIRAGLLRSQEYLATGESLKAREILILMVEGRDEIWESTLSTTATNNFKNRTSMSDETFQNQEFCTTGDAGPESFASPDNFSQKGGLKFTEY